MKLNSLKEKIGRTPFVDPNGPYPVYILVRHRLRTPVTRRCSQVLFNIQRKVQYEA
jgi:hypothetical protein